MYTIIKNSDTNIKLIYSIEINIQLFYIKKPNKPTTTIIQKNEQPCNSLPSR